jgi:hypothetical protein
MARQNFRIPRLLVLAGILLAVVDLPIVYFFGAVHSDYSYLRQFMSELGESGRPFAGLVNLWFAFGCLLLTGFGIGMAILLPPSRFSMAGISLYLLWAALGVVGGFFPCDPGCRGETFSGWMHRLIGEVSHICILPTPALIWMGVRGDPRWRGFGWVALPAQASIVVASLALGAWYYGPPAVAAALANVRGLLQWIWWAVYYGWIVALGLKLLQVERLPTSNGALK